MICHDRALGTALDWPDAKKQANLVRQWGIEVRSAKCSVATAWSNAVPVVSPTNLFVMQQLLAIWRRAKGKERDALLWGDEVSGNMVVPLILVVIDQS
jgi:glutamate--cysteine ligase catalytic subunit